MFNKYYFKEEKSKSLPSRSLTLNWCIDCFVVMVAENNITAREINSAFFMFDFKLKQNNEK